MDRIKFALFCVGTVVFNLLFWKEDLGVNLIIFLVFILIANGNLLLDALKNWQGKVIVAGAIVASAMLIAHHSIISYISAITALFVLIGYLHFSTIRTSYGVLLSAIINLFKLPEFMLKEANEPKKEVSKNWRKLRLIIIPIVIFFVFGLIFYAANVFFRNAIDSIFSNIGEFFNSIFGQISIGRILFFIVGAFFTSWIVYQGIHAYFSVEDAKFNTRIFRVRNRLPFNPGAIAAGKKPLYGTLKTLGLKNEFTSSFIMIVAICGLLFIINCIDIFTVWFGIGNDPSVNYSEAVHEGVNLLITSIILSIIIMLYVFRKNQNFYAKKQRLVIWSKVWIIQNVVLIVSVIIRNYYYISHHGLTHKRIGVFIFLLVVIAGLYSLYVKISKTKSFYFMAFFNSWSLYIMLILMSTMNWDSTIATYNVEHRNSIEIDPFYLASMSDESVIYLWKHQSELTEWLAKSHYETDLMTPMLEQRIAAMQVNEGYKSHSWISWNRRRSYIQTELKSIPFFPLKPRYLPENEF